MPQSAPSDNTRPLSRFQGRPRKSRAAECNDRPCAEHDSTLVNPTASPPDFCAAIGKPRPQCLEPNRRRDPAPFGGDASAVVLARNHPAGGRPGQCRKLSRHLRSRRPAAGSPSTRSDSLGTRGVAMSGGCGGWNGERAPWSPKMPLGRGNRRRGRWRPIVERRSCDLLQEADTSVPVCQPAPSKWGDNFCPYCCPIQPKLGQRKIAARSG
jgi:hypothetical protein